jgi:hypothetical protein
MQVWQGKFITKRLPLDPHMSKNMFAWYPKEHLLKAKQTLVHVGDLPKKHVIRDKIEPLGFQKVGLESEQLEVTWFRHFVMLFGMGKC